MTPLRPRLAALACVLLLLPALLRAQAIVTVFSSYDFENTSSGAFFYGDSSGHDHGMEGVENFSYTTSNLATTGGNSAFDNTAGAGETYAYNVANGSLSQATNWGFELLFKNPGANNTTAANIFSAGNPGSNGLAVYYDPVADQVLGSIGGATTFGSTAYVPGAWNSVALVNDGTNTTLWLNYVAVGSVAIPSVTSDTSWHMFVNPGGGTFYTGLADNINVFTFTGTFTAANLSAGGVSAVPEPATYAALCGLAGLMAALVRMHRQRRTAALHP